MKHSVKLTKATVDALKNDDKILFELSLAHNIKFASVEKWLDRKQWRRLTAPVSLEIISKHLNKPIESLTCAA
jgi:hypothetical protein